jgi:tetratricopeptide (TPR) repeat protein
MLAFGAKDHGESIVMLERAVALGARGVQVYDTLQYLHFQEGSIEEAKKWVRRAIQTNPKEPRFRYKLATLSHFVGSYEEARDLIEPLLSDHPDYWDALLLAGKVYRQLGEYEKALEALNKAGPREKGRLEFAHELGMIKLKTGDPQGAAESFGEVIRYNPEKAEAYYGLGQAYLKMGERDKAKAELHRFRGIQQSDKALKSKQAKFISNWQQALSKETDVDYEGAYASYQEALKYNQDDVSTQVLIWLLRRNQGYKIDAARAYRTVQNLLSVQGREFNELAFTLAERLIKRGFDAKAVEVLNELLLRDPKNKAARFELIRAYSRLGRDQERERHLTLFRTGEISSNP